MQVKVIDEAEWWAFVNDCPTATFFHTPDWYWVWKKYFEYNYEARLFIFESGHKVLFPLAWRLRMKGIVKEYFSGPLGTYGSVISNDKLNSREVRMIDGYLNKFSLLEIRTNPLNELLKQTFYNREDFTQLIDLKLGWDEIYKNWSKGHSSAAKKGIRDGIKIKIATEDEWGDYYKIYISTFERWKNPPETKYNLDLFKTLSLLDKKKCKLWLAILKGKIIAGALCFYFQNHVVYWHGASEEQYFSYKPVHVLQFHIIRNAIENDFKWYDFNPSGGHEGVEKFKKGFGAKKKSANVYHKQSLLYKKMFEIGKVMKKYK